MKKPILCLLLAACTALATSALRADIVGFTTTGGTLTGSPKNNTVGYAFTLANTVNVTQLGFFDSGSDGLSGAVNVTIYSTATGNAALAAATIPAGTGTELNGYIYVTLATPVTLPAGTYVIGGYINGATDYAQYNLASVTGATGISYVQPRQGAGNVYPATTNSTTGSYFGPNFQIASGVPEPSTWAMLAAGAGLCGVGILRPRRVA